MPGKFSDLFRDVIEKITYFKYKRFLIGEIYLIAQLYIFRLKSPKYKSVINHFMDMIHNMTLLFVRLIITRVFFYEGVESILFALHLLEISFISVCKKRKQNELIVPHLRYER